MLRLLLANPGTLVTKQEILDTVWADTAIEEKTLNASIAEIRHAFGDSEDPERAVADPGRALPMIPPENRP